MIGRIITVLLLAVWSIPALGEYSAQTSFGGRRYQNKMPNSTTKTYDANELSLIGLWQPFALPISTGLSYTLLDHVEGTWETVDDSSRVSGKELGLEFTAHLQFGDFAPFVRYRHVLLGTISIVDVLSLGGGPQEVEAEINVSGVHTNLGCYWQATEWMQVFVEFGRGTQMFELTKLSVDGEDSELIKDDIRPEDYNSNAAMVGFSFKFGGGSTSFSE